MARLTAPNTPQPQGELRPEEHPGQLFASSGSNPNPAARAVDVIASIVGADDGKDYTAKLSQNAANTLILGERPQSPTTSSVGPNYTACQSEASQARDASQVTTEELTNYHRGLARCGCLRKGYHQMLPRESLNLPPVHVPRPPPTDEETEPVSDDALGEETTPITETTALMVMGAA